MTVTQTFTLTVNQAPAITSVNNVTFLVGTAGSFTVTTSGYPTASLSETGTLPAGVTFVDNHNGTGTLSGTPSTSGAFGISFGASNGVGSPVAQTFALTVNQAPAITSANSAAFVVGTAGSFTVTTSGYPTPSLSETGTLPAGVTFVDNHNGTGTLSGTPSTERGIQHQLWCIERRWFAGYADVYADGESGSGDYEREQRDVRCGNIRFFHGDDFGLSDGQLE